MRAIRALAAAALLAGAATAAHPGPRLVYETGGLSVFSVEIPDDWLINVGAETAPEAMPDGIPPSPRVVSVVPAAGADMWAGFWSPPRIATLAGARDWLAGLDADLLADPKVTSDEALEVGGAHGFVLRGDGERDGETLDFSIAVLQVAPARVAVLVFIGPAAVREEWRDDLAAILRSVRVAS